MTRRDLIAAYGQVGLAIAAFALVSGIIAAPLLQKFGPSPVVASKPQDEPTFRSVVTPVSLKKAAAVAQASSDSRRGRVTLPAYYGAQGHTRRPVLAICLEG